MKIWQKQLILSAVAALLFTIAAPSMTLAQGHGRGNGRGHDIERHNRDWSDSDARRWRHYNKKCGKFVNCHDARNGRIDGRGPLGTRVGNFVWRDGRRVRVYNNNAFVRARNGRYYRVVRNR